MARLALDAASAGGASGGTSMPLSSSTPRIGGFPALPSQACLKSSMDGPLPLPPAPCRIDAVAFHTAAPAPLTASPGSSAVSYRSHSAPATFPGTSAPAANP